MRFTARSKSSKRTHPNNQITEWRSSATMKNRGTPRPRPICHPSPASTRPSRVFARSVLCQIRVGSKEKPSALWAGIDEVNRYPPVIHTWSYKFAEVA